MALLIPSYIIGKITKKATVIGTSGFTVIKKTIIKTIKTAVGKALAIVTNGIIMYLIHLKYLLNIAKPADSKKAPRKQAMACPKAIPIALQLYT
jgi:hypothetical protein